MRLNVFFVIFSAVSALTLATPFKRDVATVGADIAAISTQFTGLDTAINNYPNVGGTLEQAWAIHTAAATLDDSVKKATADTQATAVFSEADGQTILASVQAIKPTILHALTGIVDKKSAFKALPIDGIPALLFQDFKNLNVSTPALFDALTANSHVGLVPQLNQVKNAVGELIVTVLVNLLNSIS
ncbi:hypothetical protein AAF712_001889 [Marasmius tenuissimus]|uniref:Uncharacterized protein n=1 Tax=Marasmius tenuissimus TaxID=585030 RepID=A0ABR3ACF8_9AGAR|nr:hypothetical protein PM082_005567 [Marasmius tenuissimus]